ncbi:hypothetical protein HGA13_24745 [Nocardia speluncae]|uniref:Uncharacterized protein n=1 Tax=Nocardia speluncae TaxID=419477 RepID=A0A846XJS5_9NOCA|nr:hypothetical protein [Nocardia speluncae]NKY36252.1 hypothetical protein [Nocardia speluncae]
MQPAAPTAGSVGAGVDPERRARKATVPIRPLSFRELLDEPFALMQADIRVTAGCAAPLLVAGGSVVAAFIGLVSHLTDGSDDGTALAAVCATLVVAWVIRIVLRGVTVATGLARVGGAPIGARAAWWQTGQRLRPLLLTQLSFTAIGLAVLAPSMLLLPFGFLGIVWFLLAYPFCWFGLAWLRARHLVAAPVLFAEQSTARAALARAGLLTGTLRMQRTGVWICRQLVYSVLTAPLLGFALFVSDISGTHRWPFLVLLTGTVLLLAAFTEIVESSARVVGYLDLRCRREGMDIRIPVTSRGHR